MGAAEGQAAPCQEKGGKYAAGVAGFATLQVLRYHHSRVQLVECLPLFAVADACFSAVAGTLPVYLGLLTGLERNVEAFTPEAWHH